MYYGVLHALHFALLGIVSDNIAEFGNSWAVDLPQERPCPEVDHDFPGPCSSESDMDVRFHTLHNGFELSEMGFRMYDSFKQEFLRSENMSMKICLIIQLKMCFSNFSGLCVI